jgi:hypothetical protein
VIVPLHSSDFPQLAAFMPTRPVRGKSSFQSVCQVFFCYSSRNLLHSARDGIKIGASEGSPREDFMSVGSGGIAISGPFLSPCWGNPYPLNRGPSAVNQLKE